MCPLCPLVPSPTYVYMATPTVHRELHKSLPETTSLLTSSTAVENVLEYGINPSILLAS